MSGARIDDPVSHEKGGGLTPPGVVRVLRGGVLESSHRVHGVVVRGDRIRVRVGEGERWTFYRSASKPFQALPLVEDGVLEAFGFGSEELALACASHSAEEPHLRVVRRMLDRIGCGESDLACGGHWPYKEAAAQRLLEEGVTPGPLHSNCSGKHAGMLALARHGGWSLRGYEGPRHPVQERMREITARWTGLPPAGLREGVDGCGVVCFAAPLSVLAASFARLAREARAPGAAHEVCTAMMRHPFLVAGTDRLCTDLMTAVPGLVAKVGAEGVYGVAIPEEEVGIALKVEDGGWRAVDAALVSLLDRLGLLPEAARGPLADYLAPSVANTRGEVVGHLEVGWAAEGFQGRA